MNLPPDPEQHPHERRGVSTVYVGETKACTTDWELSGFLAKYAVEEAKR